ncbi:MAG: DUF413 domain-containing protein [Rhodospirillaceae bacterium]|nr:DUF413 domain-containing protein [Rhodospirillaceae bacterium]MCY4065731.1 DUF413 domain-containing protein [Rhodospirillaceae bacterium]
MTDPSKLDEEESALIEANLDRYRALDEGTMKPRSESGIHFVRVCRGKKEPVTRHEHAYLKWKRLQLLEATHRYKRKQEEDRQSVPEFEDGYPRSEFGTREEYIRDRARQRASIRNRD